MPLLTQMQDCMKGMLHQTIQEHDVPMQMA